MTVALALPAAALAGGPLVESLELSFDQAIPYPKGVIADEELAIVDFQGGLYRELLVLPEGVDLVAFHRLPVDGHLFAVDVPVVLPGGLFVEPSDVVVYTVELGYALAFELDGTGAGIDALSYDPASTTIYLSFDNDIPFENGGALHAHDVMSVSYTPEIAFGLLFSGCDAGVPNGVDVDAIHWDPQEGRLYLSFDTSTAAGAPIAADDEDVLSWTEAGGWTMVADLSAVDGELAALDTDALNVRFATDPWLFADGFESGDTSAWSGEVP